MSRAALSLVLVFTVALTIGCRNRGGSMPELSGRSDPTLPTYEQIAAGYNERTDLLTRIWARAVVSIDYIDDTGKRRYQQGDGHLQLIQPSNLALSIGKLGEVFLWVGSDEEFYWILETRERQRAFVGRHALATPGKTEGLGLPIPPLELVQLLGVAPLPLEAPPDSRVRRARTDRMVVVDLPRGENLWRYWLDPDSLRPRVIELFEGDNRDTSQITAWLDNDEQVRRRGVGGIQPRMASLIQLVHRPSDSRMKITLEGMVDGGRGKLDPIVFELPSLLESFGIETLEDLDQRAAAIASPDLQP